jgi:hypothetical protein
MTCPSHSSQYILANVLKCFTVSLGKQFLMFQKMEVPPCSGSTSPLRVTTQENTLNCIYMDNEGSKREKLVAN